KARSGGMILVVWLVAALVWPAVRLPLAPGRWTLTALAVLLAAAMRFFISFATGLLAVWTTRATAIMGLHGGVGLVVSGPRRPPPTEPTMMFRVPRSAFRVLAALWRLNLAEELQYRANFVASVLGTVFWIGTALLTLALFFRHTTRLGGWDYWEVVVLLGVFNALTGVIEAVLRPGIGRLASEVRNGGLDLVLAKPVDAQGFVSFRRLDVWHLTDVVLGLGLAG